MADFVKSTDWNNKKENLYWHVQRYDLNEKGLYESSSLHKSFHESLVCSADFPLHLAKRFSSNQGSYLRTGRYKWRRCSTNPLRFIKKCSTPEKMPFFLIMHLSNDRLPASIAPEDVNKTIRESI